jgi:hypothetical protein
MTPSRSRSCWLTSGSPRPTPAHLSNHNPYSEAQFKTLNYRPGVPDRFGSIHDAGRS